MPGTVPRALPESAHLTFITSLWSGGGAREEHSLSSFLFLKFLFIYLFDCAGSSLLLGLFSSCGEWGLLPSCVAWASHFSDFSCCGAWALGLPGFCSCSAWIQQLQFLDSRAQAPYLWCTGFHSLASEIPDQGLNPCLLCWPADSLPLRHQGSPALISRKGNRDTSPRSLSPGIGLQIRVK